jgi:hypothetical protein
MMASSLLLNNLQLNSVNKNKSYMNEKLTPYIAGSIISDCEKRIIALSTAIQDLEPSVKEYREAYLKLQFDLDTAKEKLRQEKDFVDWVSKEKNGIPQKEKIRVMRGSSHNDMPENEKIRHRRTKQVHFTWTEYAVAVLREQNVMLNEVDLWHSICDKYNVIEKFESLNIKGGISKLRYGALNACIKANTNLTKLGRSRGVLFEYRGYFGLKDWSTDDFKPKGKYASQFHQKIV